jgi:pilus assembly protein CpaB
MNKNIIFIFGGALLIALIVAGVVQLKLAKSPLKEKALAPTLEVLVANKALFLGQKLKAEDVSWKAWNEDLTYKGLIKKSEQADPEKLSYYGSPLRRSIAEGEPIADKDIVAGSKDSFLSALIAPNMRAVAINVKADMIAGGFVAPNDYVDVILAYTPKLIGATQDAAPDIIQRQASQVILKNVKVLAIDQDAKNEDRTAKVARTVTLEVSVEGAQKIALALQMGSLSLALRRLGEQDDPSAPETPMVTDVTLSDVIQKLNDRVETKKVQTGDTSVRIYSGGQVMNVPVRPAESQSNEQVTP